MQARKKPLLLLALLVGAMSAGAQTTANPVLHRRGYTQAENELDTRSSGRTLLPVDASGEYALGTSGTVDVELQPDRLSGYISRLGDRESDQGEPLTFFFATSQLSGQSMAFTTRQIHGIWFSFEGTIVRGSGAIPGKQGYYQLEGRLVLHDTASQTQQARMVSLPLARQ